MVLFEVITNVWTTITEQISQLLDKLDDVPFFDTIRNNKIALVATSILGFGLIRWLWRPRNLPPGPFGYPIIGSVLELSNQTHYDYMRMREKYGDIFSYYCGRDLHVVISSDELIREALVKRGDDFSDRPHNDIGGISDEIFSANCDEHFKLVKNLSMQALRTHVLESNKLEEAAQRNVQYVIDKLETLKGAPYDIRDILVFAASNVIYNLMFNDSFEFDDPRLKDFIDRSHEYNAATFSEEVAWTFYIKYIIPKFIGDILFSQKNAVQDERVEYFIQLALDQYKEHQKTLDRDHPRDYVDSIMIARSDAELLDMAKSTSVFVPDATDSIADFTRCCLYHMCKYPEEQKKIQGIIDNVCGEKLPKLQQRGQLSYIEATVWEVLRITCFSPVLQPHAPVKDTTLGGYFLPKGCYVWAHVFPVYKDPKLFPEPEKFKPSRFLDNSGKLVKTANSYPMGMGRRSCMGKELVKAEVLILLTGLLQRFTFKFADPKNIEPISYIGPFLATTPRFELIATER